MFIIFIFFPTLSFASYLPKIGEVCRYNLYFMGMRAGGMITEVEKTEKIKGQEVFVLNNIIQTQGMIQKFYNLTQETTSHWNNFSLKHEFSIKENDNKKSGKEEFNLDKKEMTYTKNGEIKKIPLNKNVQDQTSVFYLARTVDWKNKIEEHVSLSDYGEIKDIVLKKMGNEEINHEDTFKIMVKQGDKENFFWVAKDDKRNIVKLQVSTNSGELNGELDSCKIN